MHQFNQKSFADFVHLPNFLITSIGYDFLDKPRSEWWTRLMRLYMITAIISHLYCSYFIAGIIWDQIRAGVPDFPLFLRLVSGFNYTLCAFVKFINFVWFLRENKKCCEIFYEIFPKTENKQKQYQVNKYFWPKWVKFIIYLYLGAVTFIIISPLGEAIILYLLQLWKYDYETAKFGYNKLYEIPYSFDHHSPLAYMLTYSMEFMHGHFIVICNICPDVWLLFYSLQLCMHFDYITRILESYKLNEMDPNEDDYFIAKLVEKHLIMLDLSNRVNRVFSVLLLLMILSTTAILCCAGVYAVIQGLGRELLEYVAFLPTAIGQYFVICYYGQEIMNKSENVGNAAYNNSWYNAFNGSKSYKKSILTILIRAQKQTELNAGGVQPIGLETFQKVMGATYRAFAVLQTMLE